MPTPAELLRPPAGAPRGERASARSRSRSRTLRELGILVDGAGRREVPAADLPARLGRPLPRAGGRAVLLRDHPAQGRPGVRRRQLPGPLRVDRARAARRRAGLRAGAGRTRRCWSGWCRARCRASTTWRCATAPGRPAPRGGLDPRRLRRPLHARLPPGPAARHPRRRRRATAGAAPAGRSPPRPAGAPPLPDPGPAAAGGRAGGRLAPAPLERRPDPRPGHADRARPGLRPQRRRRRAPLRRRGGRPAALCPLGDLRFERDDYLAIPRGLLHRLVPDRRPAALALARARRTSACRPSGATRPGQLRMDAPYCHRDFRRVEWRPPRDEGIRAPGGEAGRRLQRLPAAEHSPLDVVGWDGAVYPFAFPIPTSSRGSGWSTCRPPGTAPSRRAAPWSAPSCRGRSTSTPRRSPAPTRTPRGRGRGALLRARPVHQPARRRARARSATTRPACSTARTRAPTRAPSGQRATDELAVMLDCARPLRPTAAALEVEDPAYDESFIG